MNRPIYMLIRRIECGLPITVSEGEELLTWIRKHQRRQDRFGKMAAVLFCLAMLALYFFEKFWR